MKKTFVLISISVFQLFAQSFVVTISGKINIPTTTNKIFISLVDLENKSDTPFDSVIFLGNNFTKIIKLNEPCLVNLVSKDFQNVPLLFDVSEKINLTISNSDYTVLGLNSSFFVKKYDDYRKVSYQKIMKPLYDSISKYEEAGEFDKMRNLSKNIMQKYIQHKMELSEFVQSNMMNSFAVYYSSVRWNADIDLTMIKTMVDNLKKLNPNAKITKELETKYIRFDKIKIGNIATDITCADTSGNMLKLSNYKGKYVLIDFWASWCRPCRQESANLVKLYAEFKNKNFEIFAVSLDDKKNQWTNAIKKDAYNWVQTSDLISWKSHAAMDYNIKFIPSNVLIDENQVIIARNINVEEIATVLKKRK